MNERFWELVEQADEQGGDDPDIRDRVFAELIVRETLKVTGATPSMAETAKKHFGVEE